MKTTYNLGKYLCFPELYEPEAIYLYIVLENRRKFFFDNMKRLAPISGKPFEIGASPFEIGASNPRVLEASLDVNLVILQLEFTP